ncbi:MAG: amino acid ABC transporter permease [Hyphomicrobiaceae bacterium]|nr:amino acid ABC transporter permease [Hyphomicrobiaceae bacterium]
MARGESDAAREARPGAWRERLASLVFDPRVRGIALQAVLVVAIVAFAYEIVSNVTDNLARQQIASGFGFLERTAGFDISQRLIAYSNTMTYGRAFLVGLTNTLLVAGLGIVLATFIGFAVGIARLSSNAVISSLAAIYIEVLRNIPPLLMLFAIYFAVLKGLPDPRNSVVLPFSSYINVRGLTVPKPLMAPGFDAFAIAVLIGLGLVAALAIWSRRHRLATGRTAPVVPLAVAILLGAPAAAYAVAGMPFTFEAPTLGRFNVTGGLTLLPELVALTTGLTLYTAAFIAENVRSGIEGVPKGQTEAAAALGLSRAQAMRLVIVPQALRIIVPPLTNQYLNLTKNSSLAVAIGYPDLVSVFSGTILNQTNQAIEVILITMAVYLVLSIATSLLMNWFNARMALVER